MAFLRFLWRGLLTILAIVTPILGAALGYSWVESFTEEWQGLGHFFGIFLNLCGGAVGFIVGMILFGKFLPDANYRPTH